MTADCEWRFAAASATGRSHIGAGTECQDAHRCEIVAGPTHERVVVVAVSDGAGSARRAAAGSRLAVDTAVELVERTLHTQPVCDLGKTIARGWLQEIQRVLSLNADEQNESLRDYACTFLLAVIGTNFASFTQVGDGAMVISPTSPVEWSYIFWPQNGEYANTTYFLTQDLDSIPWEHCVIEITIKDLAVFTDGLQNLVLNNSSRSVHEPFFDSVIRPVRHLREIGMSGPLSIELLNYLSSTAFDERTDDDKTLVLASSRAVESA